MAAKPTAYSQFLTMLSPVHRDGHKFIAIGALATVVLFMVWGPLGVLSALATGAIAFFFRDPERIVPIQDGLVTASADGMIFRISQTVPPPELGLDTVPTTCIATFLSLLDAHIIRTPVTGKITSSVHKDGLFHNAESEEAHAENERHGFIIETPEGKRVGAVLIAGYAARRIVTFSKVGESVSGGDRIGLIRFGSCVEIYLPGVQNVLVAEGQRMIAGETILADLNDTNNMRQFRRN